MAILIHIARLKQKVSEKTRDVQRHNTVPYITKFMKSYYILLRNQKVFRRKLILFLIEKGISFQYFYLKV